MVDDIVPVVLVNEVVVKILKRNIEINSLDVQI